MAESGGPQAKATGDADGVAKRPGPTPTRRPLWKRPITWIASVLTGAIAIAISNQVVPILDSWYARVAEQGPAVRVVSIEPLPGPGQFVFKRGFEISHEFVTQLDERGEQYDYDYVDWLVSRGAVKVGNLTARIVLEGTQSDVSVRILDVQPEVKCGDPLDGSVFTYPPAGNDDATRIEFDLDRPDAPGLYRPPDGGAVEGPFFPDRTITLEKAEQVILLVNASTEQHYCEYRMRLDILAGEDRSSIVVPAEDDEPFRVTAPLDHAAYEAVFLGGVDCWMVFRRASSTYFQDGFEPACQQPPPGQY